MSPILSIFALVMPLMEQRQTVMYADDGLIYGNLDSSPFPSNRNFDLHESGITQNESKSK